MWVKRVSASLFALCVVVGFVYVAIQVVTAPMAQTRRPTSVSISLGERLLSKRFRNKLPLTVSSTMSPAILTSPSTSPSMSPTRLESWKVSSMTPTLQTSRSKSSLSTKSDHPNQRCNSLELMSKSSTVAFNVPEFITRSTYQQSGGIHIGDSGGWTSRAGNRLFWYGTALVHAHQTGIPILAKTISEEHKAKIPNFAQLAISDENRAITVTVRGNTRKRVGPLIPSNVTWVTPASPYYQHPHWVDLFVQYHQQLCYFFATSDMYEQPAGKDDLVVHFRSFTDIKKGERFLFNAYGGEKLRMTEAPFTYYDAARADAIAKRGKHFNRTWLVFEPKLREHPTVAQMLSDWDNVYVYESGSSEADFQFMSSASTFVLSPSTFGWWAAFFSGKATQIYYPILPGPIVGHFWCNIMIRNSTEFTERLTYMDVYNLTTFPNTIAGAASAHALCREYEDHPAYVDDHRDAASYHARTSRMMRMLEIFKFDPLFVAQIKQQYNIN